MITKDLLRRLRNDLPMPVTIAALGHEGPPSKISESERPGTELARVETSSWVTLRFRRVLRQGPPARARGSALAAGGQKETRAASRRQEKRAARFLCPHCGEMRATVNPRNNLAHCFCCQKNLNNIDLLLTLDYDFRAAVTLLDRWLKQYQAQQTKKKTPPPRART